MKIRQGFVTNSSSTSFIIALKGDLTEENFFKAIGLEKDFLLSFIINDVFKDILGSSSDIFDNLPANTSASEITSNLLRDSYGGYFANKLVDKIKSLLAANWKVYMGSFSDEYDGSPISSYLCRRKILISTDDIYFNAEETSY
ncbi:MAG: hypothetical protein LBS60_01935 [Deltaproteobacteria bacterium]|jgi:hypothetical protein|nr:hypothetical protein [Deltaproteobacteria bacterium]